MGKAEENKQKKRSALLSHAFSLFLNKGISDTTISEIADHAGVGKGTFYFYFKDKEETPLGPDGKPDYTWDKAKITVWNPDEQREMELVFTGSERPNDTNLGKINFNVIYTQDRKDVFDAFDTTLKKIFPNIECATLKEYRKVFIEELVNNLKNEQ